MQHILSKMRKAIEDYNMIDEGDKIAVCLSGGKDSITMLNGLKALQRFYPKHFDLIAITVNPGFENFNKDILQKNCDEIGVPLFIEDTQIKEIVFDVRKEKNPCSLCANLRRGIINSVAQREGSVKIKNGRGKIPRPFYDCSFICDIQDCSALCCSIIFAASSAGNSSYRTK